MDRRTRIVPVVAGLAIAIAMATVPLAPSYADEWKPDRLTIIIPNPVGGGQDRLTRMLGLVWGRHLGVPVAYRNVTGGSGRKAYEEFRTSPDDGTYVMSTNLASASIMYAQQKPDWKWDDVVYLAGVFGIDPGVFFVSSESPYKTFKEVIETSKTTPLTVGIAFWASADNLLLHQIMDITGAKFQVIPFTEGPQLVAGVLGGHLNVGYAKVMNVTENGGGTMRMLAVSMPTNDVPVLSNNAPTVNEVVKKPTLAVASYRTMVFSTGFTKKHPERVDILVKAFEKAKDDPEFIAAAEKGGQNPDLIVDMNHDELTEIVRGYWTALGQFPDVLTEK